MAPIGTFQHHLRFSIKNILFRKDYFKASREKKRCIHLYFAFHSTMLSGYFHFGFRLQIFKLYFTSAIRPHTSNIFLPYFVCKVTTFSSALKAKLVYEFPKTSFVGTYTTEVFATHIIYIPRDRIDTNSHCFCKLYYRDIWIFHH